MMLDWKKSSSMQMFSGPSAIGAPVGGFLENYDLHKGQLR